MQNEFYLLHCPIISHTNHDAVFTVITRRQKLVQCIAYLARALGRRNYGMLSTLFVRKARVANARKTSYILQFRRYGFMKHVFGIQVPALIYRQNFGK